MFNSLKAALILATLSVIGAHAQTHLTGCQEITVADSYILDNDITTSGTGTCFHVATPAYSTTTINCSNYALTNPDAAPGFLIDIDNSPNVIVHNCNFATSAPTSGTPNWSNYVCLNVHDSPLASLYANNFNRCLESVVNSSGSRSQYESITNGNIYFQGVDYALIRNCNIDNSSSNDALLQMAYGVALVDSNNAEIHHCTVAGPAYDPTSPDNTYGLRDGIVLSSNSTAHSYPNVHDNTVAGIYSLGVEFLGGWSNAIVDSNVVTGRTGAAPSGYGIFGGDSAFAASFDQAAFTNNTGYGLGALLSLSPLSISNSTITSNTLISPNTAFGSVASLTSTSGATENTLTGNVFAGGVWFDPVTGWIDGGGNSCDVSLSHPSGSLPIACQ